MQQILEQKLTEEFRPQWLQVENESHQHSVPANSETHFRVVLVSEQFQGQSRIARHQAVHGLLSEELSNGIHALTLHLYTPEQWQQRQEQAPASPACMGGSKADAAG
ncbi:MAG: BolA/IbaG family iron-sulfur metabolism protein [Oleiphilaceae bacterium]|nr:BolA/IbaG family iron-sulfur metabolism protein [Oleiphilaceae bacterium]